MYFYIQASIWTCVYECHKNKYYRFLSFVQFTVTPRLYGRYITSRWVVIFTCSSTMCVVVPTESFGKYDSPFFDLLFDVWYPKVKKKLLIAKIKKFKKSKQEIWKYKSPCTSKQYIHLSTVPRTPCLIIMNPCFGSWVVNKKD